MMFGIPLNELRPPGDDPQQALFHFVDPINDELSGKTPSATYRDNSTVVAAGQGLPPASGDSQCKLT